MTEEKFITVGGGENGSRSGGWNPADFAALMGGNRGGLFGGGNFMDGVLGLFGLGIVANMFNGNGNGIFGGFGGGNSNAAAGYLSNMMQNNNGRDLLMQQITGVGNRVTELAQSFGVSTAAVQAGLSNIQLAMAQLAAQNNMSVAQLQLELQRGDSNIALQFCKCCSDQALAMCQQTNTLVNAGTQNTQRIVDSQNDGFRSILQQMYNDKLEAKNEKIGELTAQVLAKDGEISQMKQNQYIAGLVGQSQAQTQAQLGAIMAEVEAIKRCQPPTITLPNNQYSVVPTLVATAAADFVSSYWANRLTSATQSGGAADGGAAAVVK